MKDPVKKLLKTLEARAGERIARKELMKQVSDGGRPGRRGRRTHEDTPDPQLALAELELLGLVDLDGSKVLPRNPFLGVGRLSLSPQGQGFVALRGADSAARDIFVPKSKCLGALPGDLVAVRLLDRTRDRFSGRVMKVLGRGRSVYRMQLLSRPRAGVVAGMLLDAPGRLIAVIPHSRLSRQVVRNFKADVKVVVRLTGERIRHQGALVLEAGFLRFEGEGKGDVDFERICMKYDLSPEYPEGLVPFRDREVSPRTLSDWKDRQDLRGLFTVTIDGPDAKDFDDAISLIPVSGRRWKLYVHIADVGHYVKKGSPLDLEAFERSTSVYLTNRVIPMLPPVISENLCSLVAGKVRAAFTAEMEVRPSDGKILRSRFYKSIIEVDRRLTYEIAEELLGDGRIRDADSPDLSDLLALMWRLARSQREARMKAGRIDLDFPETKVRTDEHGVVTDVEQRERLRSSMLIEEFMLSANQAVAEFLRKKNVPALYRVHEPMEDTRIETLNAFFRIYNVPVTLKDASPKSIIRAQRKVHGHARADVVERVFNYQLLRSFMQAVYRGEPLGHWGLGFRDYCHFTSPIRRYPDLVVHRALFATLAHDRSTYTKEEIRDMGELTSERERRAMEAERDLMKLRMMRHLLAGSRRRFRGFVSGIRPDRVFLQLLEIPVEGVVAHGHLTNDGELIMPDDFSVYVRKLSRPAFLGEIWDLELERGDLEEIRLYFRPLFDKAKKPFV